MGHLQGRVRWGARMAACALGAALFTAAGAKAAEEHHDMLFGMFQLDQLEYRVAKGVNQVHWDAQGWIGGDDHKLWFKSEGDAPRRGAVDDAELQLLYSRRISDFFDAQFGARYDIRPLPDRGYAVIGLQGLAPYFFELDTSLFISHRGEVSARLEAEYDLLITQRLVLQPRLELNVAAQDVPSRGIGSGVNDIELGLRLRYELHQKFAPYIGVNWQRKLGETADFAREERESVDDLSFIVGVRFWF